MNNPCPSGYRLPIDTEWEAERISWSSSNAAGAFGSQLKLPMAGFREGTSGSFSETSGDYWSSTVVATKVQSLYFSTSFAAVFATMRAAGESVRCIQDSLN